VDAAKIAIAEALAEVLAKYCRFCCYAHAADSAKSADIKKIISAAGAAPSCIFWQYNRMPDLGIPLKRRKIRLVSVIKRV
jgi:hypothetical protein